MTTTEPFARMEKGFDLAQAIAEADRCLLCHDAPCSRGCPAETDPGTFIRKLRLHNVTGAIRTIKTNNILGGACGVLCPTSRLCEKECSATGISRPVEIGRIQRALVEHGWKIGFQPLAAAARKTEKVAVIGGGSVAMDCVESALKLGAKDVYLVYRRSFAQMPAEEGERLSALRQGAHFLLLNQPVGYVAGPQGSLAGVELVRTKLGAPDASGRRKPQELKGTDWVLDADVAVEAIGNRPDTADWPSTVKTDRRGLVVVDDTTGRTSAQSVYAGGDAVRGPSLVVEAVQDGKRAARAIVATLA